MKNKNKYILFSVLDFLFTFGGCAFVIVQNYVSKENSAGYKLTLTGVMLAVCMLLIAKSIFEKSYRRKHDTLLQQLAEATDERVKAAISDSINAHKIKTNIYQRAMLILPFAVLYVFTYFGATAIDTLHSSVGIICLCLLVGSVFNVIKQPIHDAIMLEKITKKVK